MSNNDDNAGVIARPPLIYLAGLLAGSALDWLWPAPLLPSPAQFVIGAALIVAGFALVGTALRLFMKAGTNIQTERPTTTLVLVGPYRYSRNPIYIALTLAYLGISIAVDSAWMLAMVVPVLIVMNVGVIAREERYLEGKFGAPYTDYKARVRRWL